MAALYQNYRPQKFEDLVGQDYIKKTLQNAVANGSFAHAYLFTGMRGTGKTSTARIFARAINSPLKNGEPDNTTPVSKAFLEGNSLDLVEIDAASNTGVENIRELIEGLKFSPTSAKYKVFIIDEVHMLSKGAFNALLKTLEEPPQHAVFILATTEVQKIPATVISRTQRFDFKRIGKSDLSAHLNKIAKKEKLEIDQPSIEMIATLSEGSVRDALSILDKLASFGKIKYQDTEKILGLTNIGSAQKFFTLLSKKDAAAVLNFLTEMFADGSDPINFNRDFLEYLRKVLLTCMGAKQDFALDPEQKKLLEAQAAVFGSSQLLNLIRLFLRANKDFQNSPNPELPLQIAAVEFCALGATAQIQKVSAMPKAEHLRDPATPHSSLVEKKEDQDEMPEPSLKKFTPISLERLSQEWPAIMKKLRLEGSTLFAIMKNAHLKGVKDNRITLSFIYKFHKESLDNHRNRELLLKIIREHFDTDFLLEVLFDKDDQNPSGDAAGMALEVFGM